MSLPRDLVMFSTADWDNPQWTNKQHMAMELAENGFRVLYVESIGLRKPTATGQDLSRIMQKIGKRFQGCTRVHESIWVLSPLTIPWHSYSFLRKVNSRMLLSQLNHSLERLGFEDPIIWNYQPLIAPLLDRIPHSKIVYHCVDRLVAAPHMPADVIEWTEKLMLQCSDVVFTTSPALQQDCSALRNGHTYYFPNVADYDHFSVAAEDGPIPDDLAAIASPRIGFVGAISEYKLDFEMLYRAANRRPDWQWVLIGQVGEGQPESKWKRLRLPNVHFLGQKSYGSLPEYLRGMDAMIIPAKKNDYTAAMFPMKFFEYLSAGKPVIACHTPSISEFADSCYLVVSEAEFEEALNITLAGAAPNTELGRMYAKKYTWKWRTEAMLEILRCLVDGESDDVTTQSQSLAA